MESTVQYVTDATGKKTAVLIPIDEYDALMEDLADLAAIAERREEPTIPHGEFIAALREDGKLQD